MKIREKRLEALMHDLLDALKFCKSVLEAKGPIWMAIEKAEAAMQKAEKFK